MSADFAAVRTTMVDSQVRTQDVTDLAIQDAMRAIPREDLVPADKQFLAYADTEVAYGPGRWMLRPRDVAKLLQGLKPRAGESVLAIAAPYAAAVLAHMGLTVTSIDAADPAPTGPFAIVVCEGAVTKAPESWLAALAIGGRLALIERDGPVGHAVLYLRSEAGIGSLTLFDCTPPVMAGFEATRVFAL